MSVVLSVNGTNFTFPQQGETSWGENVTAWQTAVSAQTLQKNSATFTLTQELDFGALAGIKSIAYKSRATNPSSSGIVRLGNQEAIGWRNQANNADLSLLVNQSDKLTFNSLELVDTSLSNLTGLITNTHISGSAAIDYSKLALGSSIVNSDVSNSAAIAYSKLNLASSIVNADVSNSAAIAFSKMASLTASRVLQSSAGGVLEPSSVTSTELGYVSGVTSAIQAQIDSKVTRPGSSTDNGVTRFDGITGQVQNSGVTIDDSNNMTVPGSLTVTGDLTVNGTTTTLNTATLDVEDVNVTINKNGNDATSEGSGITVDRTGTKGSIIYADTAASKFKVGALGSEVEVADISTIQTLSNKILNAPGLITPAIDDGIDFLEETSLSSPGQGYRRLGLKDDGKLYLRDSQGTETVVGSGSGGGINYVTNPDAEVNADGWATYADAAGSQPVDGTGGSPTLTFTRTTSSPLRGAGSFLITKDAANRQGNGASYAFTIDSADQAKVMQIDFDYSIASGTYATGDLAVYIVDVTNGTVIQPSAYQIENVGVSSTGRLTFQTASNSTSYRLCFHVASTSASAYTVKLDNVQLGPQVVPLGAPVTDWVSFTPSWTTNAGTLPTVSTDQGWWRRVGDSMEIRIFRVYTGAGTGGGVHLLTVPNGQTIDLTGGKMSTASGGTGTQGQVGGGSWYDDTLSGTQGGISVSGFIWTSTQIGIVPNGSASTGINTLFGNNDRLAAVFKVPIVGWSSSTVVSSSADTRVVNMTARNYSNGTLASGASHTVILNTVASDTHGAYNSATGEYTVKVPGYYSINGEVGMAATAAAATRQLFLYIRVNGTGISNTYTYANTTSSITHRVQARVNWYCNAGDIITLVAENDLGATGTPQTGTGNSNFSISLIQGPSQIAASEVIAFRASNTAGTSYTGGGGFSDTPFVTESIDTHGAFATPLFTAPAPGLYEFFFNVFTAAVSMTTSQGFSARFVVTGLSSGNYDGYVDWGNASASKQFSLRGELLINMNAGDTIKVQCASDVTTTLSTSANRNYFQGKRLGGVM